MEAPRLRRRMVDGSAAAVYDEGCPVTDQIGRSLARLRRAPSGNSWLLGSKNAPKRTEGGSLASELVAVAFWQREWLCRLLLGIPPL